MIKGVNQVDSTGKLVRLWIHENARVFGDRLISDIDVKMLFDHLDSTSKDKFREDIFTHIKAKIPNDYFPEVYEPERQVSMMTHHIKFSF